MSSNMEKLLQAAIEHNASDVHVKTNRASFLRIKKALSNSNVIISEEELNAFVEQFVSNKEALEQYRRQGGKSLDGAFSFSGRRFRLHLYRSMNGLNAAIRLLSENIPTLDELHLPKELKKFTRVEKGLVLICGATGSGKTTTIAALVNEINNTRAKVIMTIEDPIELVYKENLSIIEQREVGTHTPSFTKATVDAMRQDPDIIVVGELRDLDTIKNAITLAETGHLVVGTLHSKSVIDTIDRLVDVFPAEQQTQVKTQLSSVLYGIVHQQMVMTEDGVVVIVEMMVSDPVLANMLKSDDTKPNQLIYYMRTKKDIGNFSLVDNIVWHIKEGRLRPEEVLDYLSLDEQRELQGRV